MPLRIVLLILALTIALSPPPLAHADVQRGDTLMAGGLYDDARLEYEASLPNLQGEKLWEVTYKIGYCHLRRGRYEKAITIFEDLLKESKLSEQLRAQAHLQAGYCLKILRRFDQAINHFQKTIRSEASHQTRIEGVLYAGYTLHEVQRYDEAIKVLQLGPTLKKAHPVHICQTHLSTGDIHRKLKQFEQARAAYSRALAIEGTGRRRISAQTKLEELEVLTSGDAPFYIDPYVTKVSADSANLLWVSKGKVTKANIQLSAEGKTTSTEPETSVIAADGFSRRSIVLENLSAGTQYNYTIESGDQRRSGSFKTSPKGTIPLRFCVIGDTQTAASVHRQVATAMARHNPDFVVNCGDLVENGTNWFEWQSQFFGPGEAYFSKTVAWPTRGNHDGGPYYPQLFRLEKRQYYSFDYSNVHMVVLDAFGPDSGGVARQRQIQWLANDLANTTATWKIVAVHDPMVNSDTRNAWWGEKDYLPLIERLGVDIVLSGHHHLYRRYLPIGQPDEKPVIHITTGGAGGALGGNYPSPVQAHGKLDHHFLTFRVDGNRLEMVARNRDDKVLDELTLIKTQDRYQSEVMTKAVDRAVARPLASLFYQLCLPRQNRLIPMELDRLPKPGQLATFELDLRKAPGGAVDLKAFPAHTQLLVRTAEGSTWKIQPQSIALSSGRLRFAATAPENLKRTGGRYAPSAEVEIGVRIGKREFSPARLKIVHRPEVYQRLVDQEQ